MNRSFARLGRQQKQPKKPMISLLSSSLITLPGLPSFSRRSTKPRVAAPEKPRTRDVPCPKEMKRWVGRWENEGGAIVRESERNESISESNPSKRNPGNDRAPDRIMKQRNDHEEMIRYGDPLMANSRRRRGGYPVTTYTDRSPEVMAMNAHLRATRHPRQKAEKRFSARSRLTSGNMLVPKRGHPFLHLGTEYDTQARDNFIKETILFVLIVAASVWPIVHTVQTMTARW